MLGTTKTEMVVKGEKGFRYRNYRLRPECEYLLSIPLAGNGEPYYSRTTKKNLKNTLIMQLNCKNTYETTA